MDKSQEIARIINFKITTEQVQTSRGSILLTCDLDHESSPPPSLAGRGQYPHLARWLSRDVQPANLLRVQVTARSTDHTRVRSSMARYCPRVAIITRTGALLITTRTREYTRSFVAMLEATAFVVNRISEVVEVATEFRGSHEVERGASKSGHTA